ncbi:MAG: hypothetical protein JWM56_931 [Candidatus Peribacteria bacterium]|nr:hypothetical protein [Candidatus Peribacteria bacterium]
MSINKLLDREDTPTRKQSVRNEYDAILRHHLGLPSLEELSDDANATAAFETIVRQLSATRGKTEAVIKDILKPTYDKEKRNVLKADPAAFAAEKGLTAADALLKTAYIHFTDEDMRQLLEQMPAGIRPVDGTRIWKSGRPPAIPIISVDLTNENWSTGSVQEIKNRVAGKTLQQCGVTHTSYDGSTPIDSVINEILKSKTEVIDPKIPLREVTIINGPNKTIVDMPGFLRKKPDAASMDQSQLGAYFAAPPPSPGAADFANFVKTINAKTGVGIPNPAPIDVVKGIFTQLNRIGSSLASAESTLDQAVNNRQPVERLLGSTADNREILLALTVAQRNPIALDTIGAVSSDQQKLISERDEAIKLRQITTIHTELDAIPVLKFDKNQITNGISALGKIRANAAEFGLIADGNPVTLYISNTGTGLLNDLSPDEITMATTLRFPAFINRIDKRTARGGDNNNQYAQVEANALAEENKLQEMLVAINSIESKIVDLGSKLDELGIKRTDITAAKFPTLHSVFNPASYTVIPSMIGPALDKSKLIREYKEVLLSANTNKSINLLDEAAYNTKIADITSKLAAQPQQAPTAPLTSEDAWKIVRAGLMQEGLRNNELESTLAYMKARLQLNEQVVADSNSLTLEAYPDLGLTKAEADKQDEDEMKKWGAGRSKVGGFMRKSNALDAYLKELFTDTGIGLPMAAYKIKKYEFGKHTSKELTDAYFRTKYLYDLPETDPRRLPHTTEMTDFLRRLHAVIVNRGDELVTQAVQKSALSAQELQAAFGAGADANRIASMTPQERRQLVHTILKGDQYYADANKKRDIEQRVDRSYKTLKKADEKKTRSLWPFGKRQARERIGASGSTSSPDGSASNAGPGFIRRSAAALVTTPVKIAKNPYTIFGLGTGALAASVALPFLIPGVIAGLGGVKIYKALSKAT